ncbi:NAD-dependent epimerase/dehydratase family protein [Trichlorobacter lovleyi]|jgi:Nucleoside-diphosphate-sugar epimerases|uniref:NAD-dependent epimerase/dehydratase n=1 Tax=Trichlorobacter lovleyi (strain ATCC BAA-1151 / DSM 17278 / SZ) TaxID=398767 RepID=B3E1L4_TRIL1|nr:NAD-dependent epimerase/dehydratase family protein [Trichlorobacter lovleyi]ACD94106.1 NAD-dependent epimerase/dehydratase [Trichlorobacter lovleyi SZ]
MQQLFIAGCGYTGSLVANLALAQGWSVAVHLRDQEKAAALTRAGAEVCLCSMDERDDIPRLPLDGRMLLYSVPPQGGGSIDLRARNFCAALERDQTFPSKIVYLSATSVYGDTGGAVVTEQSPTEPASAMGKRRLDAEQLFQDFCLKHGIPVVILRVSAIYGKGRLPLMQINQGQPLLREELARPSNRIHIDDLARVCLSALLKGTGIYNVSDGHPASMTAYFNACADALQKPRQPQIDLEEARRVMPPLLFNYFMESRVVDNRRMLEDLDISLRYPDLQQGIAASL